MGVYFALRTHYRYVGGKFIHYFPLDMSVLYWFQKRWQRVADDEGGDFTKALLGTSVYGFDSLFTAIAEHKLPVPKSIAQLRRLLQEHLYVEGEIKVSTHTIQVLTDDDELQLAYYFFDDTYLKENRDKAAYLLRPDLALPQTIKKKPAEPLPRLMGLKSLPRGQEEGTTYCAFLSCYDSSSLTDLEKAFRIRGLRLPELTKYLTTLPGKEETPYELQILRALTASKSDDNNPSLEELLRRVATMPLMDLSSELYYAGFGTNTPDEDRSLLQEACKKHDPISEGDYRRCFVQASDHMAQICLYVASWDEVPLYHRWIFFDDLWLNAHPVLGKSILRFAARWDVLT